MDAPTVSEMATWPKPAFVRKFVRVLNPFVRFYYRYQVRGMEALPPSPCLLIGNHSGLGLVDVFCLLAHWYSVGPTDRTVRGLAHDVAFRVPGLSALFKAIGSIPARGDYARDILGSGVDVMVYPGGDLDACRPIHQPRRVLFGNRRGYVRLALAAGVKVVPVATIGSHWTVPMLPGGFFIARAFGFKRWLRAERVPLPINVVIASFWLF